MLQTRLKDYFLPGFANPEDLTLRAGYRLSTDKHTSILTDFQTAVNRKTPQKAPFWVILFPIEIRTLFRIISLKCADFFALTGIAGSGPP